jgi:hypothetical protein
MGLSFRLDRFPRCICLLVLIPGAALIPEPGSISWYGHSISAFFLSEVNTRVSKQGILSSQMIRTLRIALMLVIGIAFGVIAGPNAKADPLTFSNVVALQNNSATRVDLFSNPGTTLLGPKISFLVQLNGILPVGASNSLLVTYLEAGSAPITQTFQIPDFSAFPSPFSVLFTFTSPGATYQGTAASLTVDIIGSAPDFVIPSGPQAGQRVDSFTYNFVVAQPVPEPGTMVMLVTGVAGLWGSVRRRVTR